MENKLLAKYSDWFFDYLINIGIETTTAKIFNILLISFVFFGLIYLFDIFLKRFIIWGFGVFSSKSKNTFDDHLVVSNFPKYISHTIPLFFALHFIPILYNEYPRISNFLVKIIEVYTIILGVIIVRSILKSIKTFLLNKQRFKDKPLDSYIQVLMIFTWSVGIFLIVNQITKYSIASVASLSAASAVILLIFKDTLLGFVASIQVTVNDMVRIGDWVTFSKFGADGTVVEINLATVRVQNFDKTFTTIPTYSLTAEAFQNWRGMEQSGGRRIKRALYIKQNTIKFLTDEDIENYKKIDLIAEYLENQKNDNNFKNEENNINTSLLINGKNQTNLGVFRKYIDAYLNNNPAINENMTLMVRHLPPTAQGVPVEVYCFSNDKKWVNYEHIQSDIFDHLFASASYFDLEIFEFPSSNDIKTYIKN